MPPHPDPRVNVASGSMCKSWQRSIPSTCRASCWLTGKLIAGLHLFVGWLARTCWVARICWPTRKFVLAHEFQAVGTKMRVWDSSEQKWFLFEQLQQCHLTDLSAKTWTCKVPVNMRVRQSMPRYLLTWPLVPYVASSQPYSNEWVWHFINYTHMLPFANPCVILRERNPRCHAADVTMFARFAFAELPLYIARGSLLHPKKTNDQISRSFRDNVCQSNLREDFCAFASRALAFARVFFCKCSLSPLY